MLSEATRALWAKSGKAGGEAWHPLLAHLLDVAACARAILEREPAATRALYAADLDLVEPQALAWVCALAGLHDLGKASPAFQQKWREGQGRVWAAGLTWPAGSPPTRPPKDVPHSVITHATLPELLRQRGWAGRAPLRIAAAVGAHHGFRAQQDEIRRARGPIQQGTEAWAAARQELFDTVLAVLGVADDAPTAIEGTAFERIAGLTSFADWIGSSLPHTTLHDDPYAYYAGALARARHALDTLGWQARTPLLGAAERPTLAATFAYLGKPARPFRSRALQDEIEALLNDGSPGPALFLIEAPMGEGKTEAAFYAHLRLQAANGHRGLYVALPTQATGNAMFRRLRHFLDERATLRDGAAPPLDIQLLHGATLLNREFQELVVRPNLHADERTGEESPDSAQEGVRAAEWFTQRKRGLLSEYGVGTVDQALLAILNTKWQFVRLWGLANRVVVLDEIHAYDMYTGSLIESLVRWLHALGSSVILMSATLPMEKRRALLTAYGAGEAAPAPYPRITRVAGGVATTATFAGRKQPTLTVWAAPEDPPALAALLRELARTGGCVGCIVNTVARAQELYTLLRAEMDPDELQLFHARYPADERAAREERVLDTFGEGDDAHPVKRLQRAILIATQVVEQSLDLDFDVLVTDLAPVDLVLQRAGRLHRHERPTGSRGGHNTPVLYVAGLATDGVVPDVSVNEKIYARYVLLRSWLALRACATIALPGDIDRLVQAVYSQPDPDDLAPELGAALRRAKALLANRDDASGGAAAHAVFGEADELGWLDNPNPIRHNDDDEDPQADDDRFLPTTRQGRPSVTVIPVYAHGDGYFLDAAYTTPVRFGSKVTREEAIAYYSRSVRLSNYAVVSGIERHADEAGVPLTGWRKAPLLARCYPLILRDGRAMVGGQVVRLNPALGIVYEKEEMG